MNQLRTKIRDDERRNELVTQSKKISKKAITALLQEAEETTKKLEKEIDMLLKKKIRTEDDKEKANDIIIALKTAGDIGKEWTEKIMKLQEKLMAQ